jgi:hypothetical protein
MKPTHPPASLIPPEARRVQNEEFEMPSNFSLRNLHSKFLPEYCRVV